jgi:hypothetical protein
MFGEVVLDKVGLRSKEQEESRATTMNHNNPDFLLINFL